MSSRIRGAAAESPAAEPDADRTSAHDQANLQDGTDAEPESARDHLAELLRESAGQFISHVMQVELECYLERCASVRNEQGQLAMVRNGFQPERSIVTGIGPVRVRIPKVRSRNATPFVFRSAVVPPYTRQARRLDPALLALYLHGISTGDVDKVLAVLVGPHAAGIPMRLRRALRCALLEQCESWRSGPLERESWVELWADGISTEAGAAERALCILVVIGGNEHGTKRLLAAQEGIRVSRRNWRSVLLGLQRRGLKLPSTVLVGKCAPGFQAAVNGLYPRTQIKAAAPKQNAADARYPVISHTPKLTPCARS